MNLQLPAFLLFETHFANFSSEMLSGVYAGVISLQQPERLGVLPIKLRVVWGSRPKPGTRFREVPHKGSTVRSSGSTRFHVKVPFLKVQVGSGRFREVPNTGSILKS